MTDRTVSVRLRMEVADAVAKTQLASKAVRDFGQETSKSFGKHERDWSSLSTKVGGAGLAIGAAVGVAVMKFAEFDAEMSKAGAAAQANRSELDALRSSALEAGKATVFSATEAASAETELAKAGISTADIIGGALPAALSLATAGQLGVAQAAELSATAMTQFHIEGKEAGHVADVLAAGAGKAQGSVGDLGAALDQGGLVASQFGLSLDETVGTLSLFASAGLKGSDAGTSLKTMLQRLNPQSKEAAGLMDELGLRAYDAQGQFVGLDVYAEKLKRSLSGMSEEQRNAALQTLFGSDAIRGANLLYQAGAEGVQKWTSAVNDQGYASKLAAAQMDNLKGDIEQFTGSLETAFITAGSGGNDFARGAVQNLTGVVNVLGDLPPQVTSTALTMGALTAATLLSAAAAVKGVAGYRALSATLTTVTGSATGASRALTAVGTAFGVVAVAASADALGDWVGQSRAATVETDKLAASLRGFGTSGEISADGLRVFDKDGIGPLGNKAEDTSEALRRFGTEAHKALDQGWNARLGRMQDMGSGTSEFEKRVGQLDGALGKLVESGNAEEARASFDRLTEAAVKQGLPLDVITRQFPIYTDAVKKSTQAELESLVAMDNLTPVQQALADNARDVAAANDEITKSLSESTNGFLDARSASRAYFDSLDAVKESLKENGRTLDDHTAKGRANAEVLDTLGSRSRDYLASVRAQKGPGKEFDAVLATTRANLEKAAERFGMSKAKAKDYADAVLAIRPSVSTTVYLVGIEAAREKIAALSDDIRRIPSLQAAIYNNAGNLHEKVDPNAGKPSTGRKNDRQKKAQGGFIPGPPSTADTVAAYLSTGEYVIKAAAVQRYGVHMFDHLNAERFATGGLVGAQAPARTPFVDAVRVARFADGGLVAAARTTTAPGPSITYGDDVTVLQLDSAVAARQASGFVVEAERAQLRHAANRSRRRPR